LARGADPHPWRDRFRQVPAWEDLKDLQQLARDVRPEEHSPQVLIALAHRLDAKGGEPVPVYQAAALQFPRDFWLHLHWGNATKDRVVGLGCHRTAVAIRPRSSTAHNNLGNSLFELKDFDGAIWEYRKAIELEPASGDFHYNIANVFYVLKDLDRATASYRQALQFQDSADIHLGLGNVLVQRGELDGAAAEYERTLQLDPNSHQAYCGLGDVFFLKKDHYGAAAKFRHAIQLNPKDAYAHRCLATVLMEKDDFDGAAAAYRTAIELDPNNAEGHYGLGMVLCCKKDLNGAYAACQRAIQVGPKEVLAHHYFAQILLYRCQFVEARQESEEAHRLLPSNHPWREVTSQQIQRCERMLGMDRALPEFLKGADAPKDLDDRLAMAELCGLYRHYHVAAYRLYASAFTAQPALADDLPKEYRYSAACSAALAAAGEGLDPPSPGSKEVVKLRAQALAWLRADLAQWAKQWASGKAEDRWVARHKLEHWQTDRDLASLREGAAFAKLSEGEQLACRQLWAEVKRLLASE
jgi:tetratricopeptide (TPR) repeat protein